MIEVWIRFKNQTNEEATRWVIPGIPRKWDIFIHNNGQGYVIQEVIWMMREARVLIVLEGFMPESGF